MWCLSSRSSWETHTALWVCQSSQPGQLSVLGTLCFGAVFRGVCVLEYLLGSAGIFQWWNVTGLDGALGRMFNTAGGHVPFEGERALSRWYCLSIATYKVKPDSILGFSVHFSRLSVAGQRKAAFTG